MKTEALSMVRRPDRKKQPEETYVSVREIKEKFAAHHRGD